MNVKKGQSTVSGLVMLIGLLIVLYILLMPPCEKCQLLNEDCPIECQQNYEEGVLLSVSPNNVGFNDQIFHTFSPINLIINSQPDYKSLANDIEISRSWFGSKDRDFNFRVEDLEDLDSVTISFLTMESKGNLYIYFNDKQLFFGMIPPGEVKNIHLPLEYFSQNNILSFYVEPPGFFFWNTNKYLLKDLELKKDFVKIQSIEERQFLMSSDEKNYIDESLLKYSIFCTDLEDGVANFKVYLNNLQVYSEFITCTNDEKTVEIAPSYFNEGQNMFKFILDDGNFLITEIVLENKLGESIFPNYEFEVDSTLNKVFSLDIEFGSESLKEFKLKLNDNVIDVVTSGFSFEQDITNFINVGKNNIQLVSDLDLDIEELKISYV